MDDGKYSTVDFPPMTWLCAEWAAESFITGTCRVHAGAFDFRAARDVLALTLWHGRHSAPIAPGTILSRPFRKRLADDMEWQSWADRNFAAAVESHDQNSCTHALRAWRWLRTSLLPCITISPISAHCAGLATDSRPGWRVGLAIARGAAEERRQ